MQRDLRLDYLKACAISFVLIWHLQPIKFNPLQSLSFPDNFFNFLVINFDRQISLIAVPVFLLVSLYLFHVKYENQPLSLFNNRVNRVAALYVFWAICQFLFFIAVNTLLLGNKEIFDFATMPSIPSLIMAGGPSLPIVGDSVFYFLFVLLILLLITSSLYVTKFRFEKFFPLHIAIIAASLIYFEIIHVTGNLNPYWRLDNFLLYIPLSYYVFWLEKKDRLGSKNMVFLFLYFIFSIQDLYLANNGGVIFPYSRLSIVFGAIGVFTTILKAKNLKPNRIISFLSRYSLGLFAIHKFVYFIVVTIIFTLQEISNVPIKSTALDIFQLIVATITIGFTVLLIQLAKNTPLKKVIS